MTGHDSANKLAGVSISGPEQAEAIIMLHGAMGNRHMWEGVIHHLNDSFRCISVDLPGHGDLIDHEFTTDSATGRIGQTLDVLNEDRAALVGLSLGGYIAQAYTTEHPDRVSGLVICGATMPFTGSAGFMFRLTGYLIPLFSGRAVRGFTDHLKSDVDPEIATAILKGGLSPTGGAQSFRELAGTDHAHGMVGFSGPILIANGERDAQNRKAEQRFRDLFPQAEIVTISDASHAPPVEQPESFAGAVRRLMALTADE
ncbi:MAG TPA: alpha/beta fold hydrolase [Acidimicrobiia bacterium]